MKYIIHYTDGSKETVEADDMTHDKETVMFLSDNETCGLVNKKVIKSVLTEDSVISFSDNPFPFDEELTDESTLPPATMMDSNRINLVPFVVEYLDGSVSNLHIHDYKVEDGYLFITEDKWDDGCWQRLCLIEFIHDYYLL